MNRNVNAISGRLSLRKPQRDSLEILHRITELGKCGLRQSTRRHPQHHRACRRHGDACGL